MAYPNGDTPGIAFPPPLVFVLGFAVGYALQRLFPITLVPAAGRGVWQGLGWGLVALGAALMGSAVVTFRRAGTTPNPFKPTTAFVTRGPYRFTRNPMYVGLRVNRYGPRVTDRKSTRLNSSHLVISYAVFCLKKKNEKS